MGALFAAQDGVEAIPQSWRARVTKLGDVEACADQLVAQRVIIEIM